MARRGENIRKRTDGRWEGRYIEKYDINGKACYRSVYGSSYSSVFTAFHHLQPALCFCSRKVAVLADGSKGE